MDPSDYLAALRKRWLVIYLLAVLGGAAGFAVSATTTPVYRATSKVFVSLEGGETVSELVQGSTYTQNLVQSYVALATMPIVLEPVIQDLGLDTDTRILAKSVTAEAPINTVIIEIAAVDTVPAQAAEIADAVAAELASAVDGLGQGAGPNETVSMRTVAPADVPEVPVAPNTRLLVGTGVLAGLAAGVLFALARELLDTKVRDAKDVNRVTDAAVLGSIGWRRGRSSVLVMRSDPHSPMAEAYRRLRTNLKFLDFAGPIHSVVVTSALPGDGKSTTSVNLALALAEGQSRILLVDADLRRPAVAEYLGLEGSVGLTTVLIGSAGLDDVIQPYGGGNLDVLTAGTVPPNPTQLLSSPAMSDVLAQMKSAYDLVIIDSPPLLPVTDSAILARMADGALVVAAARKVRRHQLAEAIRSVTSVGAVCLGVVLNRVDEREADSYYGYTSDAVTGRGKGRNRRRTKRRRRPASDPALLGDLLTPLPEPAAGGVPARHIEPSAPPRAEAGSLGQQDAPRSTGPGSDVTDGRLSPGTPTRRR